MKKSKDFDEPYNEHNYYNGVQNSLDGSLHGNIAIHQPQQNADYQQCEYNGDEWHFISPIMVWT
jgi:hypothetical protein